MPELTALHDVVAKVLKYSTPFGNLWVATTFFCRLIPVATIGKGKEMVSIFGIFKQRGFFVSLFLKIFHFWTFFNFLRFSLDTILWDLYPRLFVRR